MEKLWLCSQCFTESFVIFFLLFFKSCSGCINTRSSSSIRSSSSSTVLLVLLIANTDCCGVQMTGNNVDYFVYVYSKIQYMVFKIK